MEVMEYKGYGEFKAAMDKEVAGVAQGFVKMGYLLKVARDTDILKESGYGSVAEFAQAEYGLTKDIVSRYIAINDRFSEGGYSEKLNVKYSEYGVAKLAEMLTLSDEVIESLSPQLTRKEIQEVKKDIFEENKITELEVLMEGKEPGQQCLEDNLSRFLHQYGREQPKEYIALHDAVNRTVYDGTSNPIIEKILDVLAPTGIEMIRERLQGVGLLMLSIRGKEKDLELLNVRNNEKEVYTWDTLISCLEQLCTGDEAKMSWEQLYGEKFPEEKQEVAPVQPNLEEKTPETRINIKCDADLKSETLKEEKSEEKIEENVDFIRCEEQLPGQMNVDDYPELKPNELPINEPVPPAAVPENITEQSEIVENLPETAPKSGENAINIECEPISEEDYKERAIEYSEICITDCLKGWENEEIPLEELNKIIENTEELLKILKEWRIRRQG